MLRPGILQSSLAQTNSIVSGFVSPFNIKLGATFDVESMSWFLRLQKMQKLWSCLHGLIKMEI